MDGMLPPWTSWWPPGELEALVPDDDQRAALVESCPPIPASLLAERLPALGEEGLGRTSYLRLSTLYEPFAAQAEEAGWPVRRLEAHHLAILSSPAAVVDELRTLSVAN